MIFEPVNDLERSLIKAATDPAHRPQFYRDFLDSDIFALQPGPLKVTTERRVSEGETIQLVKGERDGRRLFPFSLHWLA